MSIKDLVDRGRATNLIHLEEQESLTLDKVLPVVPELVEEITRIRKRLDDKFQRLYATKAKVVSAAKGDMDPASYPIGFCKEICEELKDQLSRNIRIQELVSKGVVFRSVYIILYGRYFQNALQLGNLYFDAANDTVDPKKPFLEWMPINELDYENLETWEQVIPVVESYLHCRVVPNHVFPLLAPLVPLLGIRSNRRIDLLFFQDNFFLKDLGDGMQRYLEWITSRKGAAARRLNRSDIAMLTRQFGANDFDHFPFEFSPATVHDLVAQAQELVEISQQEDGEKILLKLSELSHQAVRLFRRKNLLSSRKQG
jgi:hypothetical protein